MADTDPREYQSWLFWAPPHGKPERLQRWLRRYATIIRRVARHHASQEEILLVAFLPSAVEIEALFYKAEGELENFLVSPLSEHRLSSETREEEKFGIDEREDTWVHLWSPHREILAPGKGWRRRSQTYSVHTNLWVPTQTTRSEDGVLRVWDLQAGSLDSKIYRQEGELHLGLHAELSGTDVVEADELLESAMSTLDSYINSIQHEQEKLRKDMNSFSSDLQASAEWARRFAAGTPYMDGESVS